MLPDLHRTKEDLNLWLKAFFAARLKTHMGAFGESPKETLQEGHGTAIVRPDGTVDRTSMRRASGESTVRNESIKAGDLGAVLKSLDEAAQQMGRQIAAHAYKEISDAADRVGNTVSTNGFTADGFLAALEVILVPFTKDGEPIWPQCHIPPSLAESAKTALETVANDPTYARRFAELKQEKRKEWDAREAGRRLAG